MITPFEKWWSSGLRERLHSGNLRVILLSQTPVMTVIVVIVRDVSDCVLLDFLTAIRTHPEAVFDWRNMAAHVMRLTA